MTSDLTVLSTSAVFCRPSLSAQSILPIALETAAVIYKLSCGAIEAARRDAALVQKTKGNKLQYLRTTRSIFDAVSQKLVAQGLYEPTVGQTASKRLQSANIDVYIRRQKPAALTISSLQNQSIALLQQCIPPSSHCRNSINQVPISPPREGQECRPKERMNNLVKIRPI